MCDRDRKPLRARLLRAMVGCCSLVASAISAAEPPLPDPSQYARQVTFEMTFNNRDLVWLGDAASPNALVYPKLGATPIATDAHVTTLMQTHDSPSRQYLREARIDVSCLSLASS